MAGTELNLRGVAEPELVFGLVGALGSPMQKVVGLVASVLSGVAYKVEEIRLSNFLKAYELTTPGPAETDPRATKWNTMMSRGNELREALGRGDALAMHAAVEIHNRRGPDRPMALARQAFVLRQLKHQDEVRLLRQIYGDSFHLIGVYTPEEIRSQYLRNVEGMDETTASQLIDRDSGEELRFGQQVTKTFHLSDLFLKVQGWDDGSIRAAREQIERYIDLLFGRRILTPTVDEYGMFLAHAAALRSSDLSRQVGAAILTEGGDAISLGANEVPKAGGGQYWAGDPHDDRDFVRGYDSNERLEMECAQEVLRCMNEEEWGGLSPEQQTEQVASFASLISNARLMHLTEFGRAVHAEMEAILSAARMGTSVLGQTIYTTTFPCHNCAKHIVGAGLRRVVYVEPYSKSLADRLHGDAIAFSLDEKTDGHRIPFEPFHGIAPRRLSELFSMVEKDGGRISRKLPGGNVRTNPVGLRTAVSPLSHVDREAMVADFLQHTMTQLAKEE